MFFTDCENIANKEPILKELIQKIDELLQSINMDAVLRVKDFAVFLQVQQESQVRAILNYLTETGLLIKEEMVECEGCQNLMDLSEYNQALMDDEDFECSLCGNNLMEENLNKMDVYRRAGYDSLGVGKTTLPEKGAKMVTGKDLIRKEQNMIRILHLSDLHFGTGTKENADWKAYPEDMDRTKLLDDLKVYLENLEHKPDFVVISGDTSIACQEKGFQEFPQYFQNLIDRDKLPAKDNIIIVPGNHDVDRNYPGDSEKRFKLFHRYIGTEYVRPWLKSYDIENIDDIKKELDSRLANNGSFIGGLKLANINDSIINNLKGKLQNKIKATPVDHKKFTDTDTWLNTHLTLKELLNNGDLKKKEDLKKIIKLKIEKDAINILWPQVSSGSQLDPFKNFLEEKKLKEELGKLNLLSSDEIETMVKKAERNFDAEELFIIARYCISSLPFVLDLEKKVFIYAFNSASVSGTKIDVPVMDSDTINALFSTYKKRTIELLTILSKYELQIDPARFEPDEKKVFHTIINFLKNKYKSEWKDILKIAVLHHHLVPFVDEEVKMFELMTNAGLFKQILIKEGFHIVLHGHKHTPDILLDTAISGGGALQIISGNTVGGGPGRTLKPGFNMIDWEIDAHSLEVKFITLDQADNPQDAIQNAEKRKLYLLKNHQDLKDPQILLENFINKIMPSPPEKKSIIKIKPKVVPEKHTKPIFKLAWSTDGKKIASASQDGTVQIWNVEIDENIIKTFEYIDEVYSIAWSPDGKEIISVSADQIIRKENLEDSSLGKLLEIDTSVYCIDWFKDNIAIGLVNGHIQVLDTNLDQKNAFTDNNSTINDLTFSPDGKFLATGLNDGNIIIWNYMRKVKEQEFKADYGEVHSIKWSPDGKKIAAGYSQNTVIIWDKEGEEKKVLEGHNDWITAVSFSHKGEFLASKSRDNTVRIWDWQKQEVIWVIHELASEHWGTGLTFHPKAPVLATLGDRDKVIRLWDLDLI